MGTGIDFRKSDEVLLAAEISRQLNVRDGKLYLGKTLLEIHLPGKKGKDGKTPKKGIDYDDGKDGYTPVKGKDYRDGTDGITPVKGKDYDDGKKGYTPVKDKDYRDGTDGKTPAHRWSGTCLSFQNPDGSWEEEVDLRGTPGEEVKGDPGNAPAHEWSGTSLRVQNPDGSWGEPIDLRGLTGKGDPGKRGYTPKKGIDYKDGDPGEPAVLPEALDMVILVDAELITDGGLLTIKKKFAQIRIYPKA